MTGYADALSRAAPARTVWLVVAPLLAGIAAHALGAARRRGLGDRHESPEHTRLLGAGCLGIAVGAYAGHVLVLARGFHRRGAIVQSLFSWRAGQVHLGQTLCFDPLGAGLSGVAVLVGLAFAVHLSARPPAERPWTAWTRVELGMAGTLLAALADDVLTMAVGWTLAALACAWRAATVRPEEGARIAARGTLAIVGLLAGGAWLLFGTGGAWSSLDEPGGRTSPGIGVVSIGPADEGGSTLRMVSWPHARLVLDDAPTPLAVAPFTGVHLEPGHHDLRVRPGVPGAVPDEERVEFSLGPEGQSLAVEPWGATLSFRELAVNLASTEAPTRRFLEETWPGSGRINLACCVFLSWLVAICAIVSILPRVRMLEPAVLGGALLSRSLGLAPLLPTAAWIAGLAVVLVFAIVDDRRVPEDALERTVAGGGRLLVRFERWVLDAVASAAAAVFWGVAFAAAWLDTRAIGAPFDTLAVRVARAGHQAEPVLGGSLVRVGWMLLGALAAVVLAATYAASR